MKIVYIPLDERPCNYAFAQQIAKGSPIELAVPAMDLLGSKKTPTDTAVLVDYLQKNCADADALVL